MKRLIKDCVFLRDEYVSPQMQQTSTNFEGSPIYAVQNLAEVSRTIKNISYCAII